MSRHAPRRGHRRGAAERAPSSRCECGNSRRRPDGTIAIACPRCSRLDGSDLSPAARALLSELRHLGRATWDAIQLELPDYERRTLYRALNLLASIGRVRRVEERNVIEQGISECWAPWANRGRGARVSRGRHERARVVAAFELVLR